MEGEFAAVHASESLQAALREADLERVQKEAAEAAAERLEVCMAPSLQDSGFRLAHVLAKYGHNMTFV